MYANNILAVEMEAFALYAIANALGKKALTVLTISDNIATGDVLSAEDRKTKFKDMFLVVKNIIGEIGG
jgi:purine-nucleoside phosphorylase